MSEEFEICLNKFYNALLKECEIEGLPNMSSLDKMKFIENFILTCPVEDVDDKIINLQDEYLNLQKNETNSLDATLKDVKNFSIIKDFSLLNIKGDVLIEFSTNLMFDNFSTDADLIKFGGIQLKKDMYKALINSNNRNLCYSVNVFDGYNLRIEKVLKILVEEKINQEQFLDSLIRGISNFSFKTILIDIKDIKNNIKIKTIKKAIKKSKTTNKIIFVDSLVT